MPDIKQREEKMKAKRRNTPYRVFLKDIASFLSLNFYRDANGLLGKYPHTSRTPKIISCKTFDENIDTLTKNGLDYDFSLSVFDNFEKLFRSIEVPNLRHTAGSENCEFADVVNQSKNVYLSCTVTTGCENVCYSYSARENSTNVFNSVRITDNSENIYMTGGAVKSFNVFFSRNIFNSSDIRFCSGMIGCHECLFCTDLENQSYCIHNTPLDKEAYFAKKKELLMQKEKFMQRYTELPITKANYGSTDTEGVFLINSEHVHNGYYAYQLHGGNNIVCVGGNEGDEDVYDVFTGGAKFAKDFYGVQGCGFSENIYSSVQLGGCTNIYYSQSLLNSSYCLACFGLINKQFCILNKEYSKEERFELANKIFAQMDEQGILGDFFPPRSNTYYFNDTAAYLLDATFTKEEATKAGFLRRDEEIKTDISANADVVETKKLVQYQGFDAAGEWKVSPEILKKVIRDDKGNYYKIVPMELDFLQKHGLPLPEIHRLERIKLGFKFK